MITASPAKRLHALSAASSIWTTIPATAQARQFQTQAFHFRESDEIELQPDGKRGPFTHMRFSVCLLPESAQYVPAKEFTPPQWTGIHPAGGTKTANVILEIYDRSADRFARVLEKQVSRLLQPVDFDLPLPFPLAPGRCVVRIAVELDQGSQALVYQIAPYHRPALARNVILLSLDTHSLQQMSLVETQSFDTSPTLRRLAQNDSRARLYTGAVGVSSWTLPTHATMFTGLYPTQHGLIDQNAVAEFSADIRTLPELLQSHGVKTYHLAAHTRVGFTYGYYRGVSHYRQYDQPLGQRGRCVLRDAARLLQASDKQDTFMFLHLFDAHLPYNNFPKNHPTQFEGVVPRSPDDLCKGTLYRDHIYGDDGWKPQKRLEHIDRYGKRLAPQMSAARAAYQLGLRDVDDMISEFITALKQAGLWEQTSLVIVADHGEEFFEHGLLTHTSLYQQNINVPFLIRLGDRVDSVSDFDSETWHSPFTFEAHTTTFRVLLDLFGVDPPGYLAESETQGLGLKQLLGLKHNRAAFSEFYLLPQARYHEASLITEDGNKLIYSTNLASPTAWREQDVHVQLFDLAEDPGNLQNLFVPDDPNHHAEVERTTTHARKIRRLKFPPTPRGSLTPAQIKKLRALGYIH